MAKNKKRDTVLEEGAVAEEMAAEEAVVEEAPAEESDDTKYLRLAADFQNYKRRMEKERFERYSDGKKDFAADLLPTLDNFDCALAQDMAQAETERERALIEGMDMILRQFREALAKNGVGEIPSLGEDFDPNMHHAVVMEPSDRYESQKVSEVLQKGYRIGDKVIRPSMVKVAE
ncbi:MAG: nucleotide exchange factor GrpE [Clostridiales bacterium]|nr:nucleotide exchange factor GrpE [Clostridiales bacterium]